MVKVGKSTVLIGLQYGDEGKARVMDTMLKDYNAVVRFNGGPNAGHTLEVGKVKIALHQIPSGIFYKDMKLYIGSGCVINPKKILEEKKEIESNGINIDKRFFISGFTTLIQPHHILFDGVFGKDIGSTKNGIGAAYSDQAIRAEDKLIKNIRFGDYVSNPQKFKEIVKQNLLTFAKRYNQKGIDAEKLTNEFHDNVMKIAPFLSKDPLMLTNDIQSGKSIFFEGAQSIMLDVIYGAVPYLTSSRTVAGAAYTGGDLSNKYHHKTIGVAKAIMSRVGNGPFISEFGGFASEKHCAEGDGQAHMKEAEAKLYNSEELLKSGDMLKIGIGLRMISNEYGATTKRPRRIGMLDLVQLKQNCLLNGVDEIYINKFDCLSDYSKTTLKGIPIVTGYKLEGKTINYSPSSVDEMRRTEPIITYFPHIKQDISNIRDYKKLPKEVKDLIKYIEKYVGVKVGGIGVGPQREQFVKIK